MKTKQEIKEIMLKALKEHYVEFLEDREIANKKRETGKIDDAKKWEQWANKERGKWCVIWDLLLEIGVSEEEIVITNAEAVKEFKREL